MLINVNVLDGILEARYYLRGGRLSTDSGMRSHREILEHVGPYYSRKYSAMYYMHSADLKLVHYLLYCTLQLMPHPSMWISRNNTVSHPRANSKQQPWSLPKTIAGRLWKKNMVSSPMSWKVTMFADAIVYSSCGRLLNLIAVNRSRTRKYLGTD